MGLGRSLLIAIAAILLFSCCANADCSDQDGAKSPTLLLKKKLFCKYDKHIQPVKEHTSVTNISVLFLPYRVELYSFSDLLVVHGFISLEWMDENLSWNKTDYENVESLTIPANSIWIPDLSDIEESGHLVGDWPCVLHSTGHVSCGSGTTQWATCVSDVTRWPFDKHTCTMVIQNWAKTQNLNITLEDEGISNTMYKPGVTYELLNSSVTRIEYVNYHQVIVSRLTYTFILRRHSGEGAAGVVLPAVALASLNCLTFLLRPTSTGRLSIICINIVSHCLYLLHMSYRVKVNGESTPLIVLFYRDSLLMAALSLIITIFVRNMNSILRSPPSCVVSAVNEVLATRLGQVLLLIGEGPYEKDNADSFKQDDGVGPSKCLLGATIDALSFLAFVVVTVLSFAKFIYF